MENGKWEREKKTWRIPVKQRIKHGTHKKNTCSIVGVDQCVRCICGKRYSAVFEGIRCHVRVHFARLYLFDVCTKILCFRRTVKIKANKKSRWNKLKTYTFYREMKSNTHYTEHIEGTAFMSFLLSCNLSLCINQSKENTAARQMPDYHFCFRSYLFFLFLFSSFYFVRWTIFCVIDQMNKISQICHFIRLESSMPMYICLFCAHVYGTCSKLVSSEDDALNIQLVCVSFNTGILIIYSVWL